MFSGKHLVRYGLHLLSVGNKPATLKTAAAKTRDFRKQYEVVKNAKNKKLAVAAFVVGSLAKGIKDKRKANDASTGAAATPWTGTATPGNSQTFFVESSIMSELCALVYTVAYLIDVVGKGGYPAEGSPSDQGWFSKWFFKPKLKQLEKTELVIQKGNQGGTMVQHNLPAAKVLEFVDVNQDALSWDPEITGDAEDGAIHTRTLLLCNALDTIRAQADGSYLWAFDHKFEGTGIVYGITVNRELKRVTVVFRGSVTGEDWWQNGQIRMTPLKIPGLLRDDGFAEPIKLHGGFKRYLFDDDIEELNLSADKMDKKRPGKYGRILRDLEACFNHEEDGKKVHEGFHLYVTGHSLGGALSAILAMKLAASHFIQKRVKPAKPVINISVAAPYVGNEAYLHATQVMEDKGWLRHVRMTNQKDVVPVAPPRHFLYNALYEPYFHTGLNVHLLPDGTPKMGFGVERSFVSQLSLDSGDRHAVSDYWTRQNDEESFLSKTYIEKLYDEYKNKH